MLKNSVVIFIISAALFSTQLNAQEGSYTAIKKGDVVPNTEFVAWKDDSSFTAKLSDFTGKSILIDFWSSFCPSCLSALPELAEWQSAFENNLQILVVTSESRSDLLNRLRRLHKNTQSLTWREALRNLILVPDDSVFCKVFPYKILPTHVWINRDLTLKTVAYSSSTNLSNLKSFIEGKDIKLDELHYLSIDISNPLTWPSISDSILPINYEYAVRSEYIENGQKGTENVIFFNDNNSSQLSGIACLNISILNLYKIAYCFWRPDPKIVDIPNNRIIIESKKPQRFSFFYSKDQSFSEWYEQNAVCFAFKSQPRDSTSFFSLMIKNLDFYFDIKSRIEFRMVNCWVLRKNSKKNLLKTKGKIPSYISKNGYTIINNLSIDQLRIAILKPLRKLNRDVIFLDKTNYHDSLDIILDWDKYQENVSIETIQNSLKKFDLILINEKVMLPMLIFTEKSKKR